MKVENEGSTGRYLLATILLIVVLIGVYYLFTVM